MRKNEKFIEDLRQPIPKYVRGYEGEPDLRGVERVSFLIGTREFNFSKDGETKLIDISEFHWQYPDKMPQVVVSLWENQFYNELLGLLR